MNLTQFLADNRLNLNIKYMAEYNGYEASIPFCDLKIGTYFVDSASVQGLSIKNAIDNLCIKLSNHYLIIFPHSSSSKTIRIEDITNNILYDN